MSEVQSLITAINDLIDASGSQPNHRRIDKVLEPVPKAARPLLADAIAQLITFAYMAPGASESKRRYFRGRIAALLECLSVEPSKVLAIAVKRWTTERHAPGDDITYPEGTHVEWMRGCIHAAQDVIKGVPDKGPAQGYEDKVVI